MSILTSFTQRQDDRLEQRQDEVAFNVRPMRVARFLVCAVAIVTTVGTIANLAIFHVAPSPDHALAKFLHRFDLGFEPSIPAWLSSLGLLTCAILLGLIAIVKRRATEPFVISWTVLALLFVCLSLDEAIMIHEMVDTAMVSWFDTTGIFYFAWVLPGILFVAIVALVNIKFLLHLDRQTRLLFIASGALFVGGAIGMELFAGVVVEKYGVASVRHTAVQSVEESLEMLGVVLFIYALLKHLSQQVRSVRLNIE
jgi:hypothetical protein